MLHAVQAVADKGVPHVGVGRQLAMHAYLLCRYVCAACPCRPGPHACTQVAGDNGVSRVGVGRQLALALLAGAGLWVLAVTQAVTLRGSNPRLAGACTLAVHT